LRIVRFSRTSGRDLTEVRRPRRPVPLDTLKKPELVKLAEAEGLDTSGTKAELIERLSDG
jgi:hypothetical protein